MPAKYIKALLIMMVYKVVHQSEISLRSLRAFSLYFPLRFLYLTAKGAEKQPRKGNRIAIINETEELFI